MQMMQRTPCKQSGLVIVMLVLVLVVLLGVAAFALDLGRLYVLKTEMQNAADAAALAAAAELNGEDDAIERAKIAATEFLEHDSHFSKVKELLGEGINVDADLKFYCSIGGSQDTGAGGVCTGSTETGDPNKILVPTDSDDEQAHYVRVTLDPDDNEDRYGIDLYFLPVLSVVGIETSKVAVTTATALAGRHFSVFCKYPPLMVCDDDDSWFKDLEGENVGKQVLLKLQTGSNKKWDQKGAFGILDFDGLKPGGANETKVSLADEEQKDCSPAEILIEPGSESGPFQKAINTRFGRFDGEFKKTDYTSAPNVMSYGGNIGVTYQGTTEDVSLWRDIKLRDPKSIASVEDRFGDGDWDHASYFSTVHGLTGAGYSAVDSNGDGIYTRWETYNWELDTGSLPTLIDGSQNPPSDVAVGNRSRRVIYVAVVNCEAHGGIGNELVQMQEGLDGFAQVFITEEVDNDKNFFVEYISWAENEDDVTDNYHIVVQLYE